MGLLRDLQRRVDEGSSLLLSHDGLSRGGAGGAETVEAPAAGGDASARAGGSPRRAPFAASRESDTGAARPTGSRYYTSDSAHAEDGTTTPIWLTSLNIMNSVIGSGVVSLPYAIYQSGLPLGILLCILVAVLSSWTVRLLANLGQAHSSGTYEDLGHRAFGPLGFYAVCAFQGLFSFGAMCSYLVIFADLVPPALSSWTTWADTAPNLIAREVVLAIPAVCILLPLCLYRAYGHLAKYSIIKALSITFLAATVLTLKFQIGEVGSVRDDKWKYRDVHTGFLPAVGTIAFAFVCQHQTFLAWRSLRNVTQRRFAISIHLAMLGGLSLSLVLAIAGYLTFFETTNSDILFNYENYKNIQSSPLLNAARVLVSVGMFLAFPADLMVVRGTLENVLEARRKYARWLRLQSPVHDIRLLTALKAQEDSYRAESADAWALRDGCSRGIAEHVLITVLLFAGALGVALSVTDLGIVTEISGATSAVFLAFVLPAAIRLRLGPSPEDTNPICHRNNRAAWGVLAFGLVAFITSSIFMLVEIAQGQVYGGIG